MKWCCCQCISATGAGGAVGVGSDVVLQGFVQHEGMVVTRFHHSWSWSIKLVQFHTGDGLTGDQNVSCPKVQGNFLLLCSSTNFVGYSYN